MDDDEPALSTEWAFTLLALVTAPVWVGMAWYWDDLTPILGGVVCQAFGIYRVYMADWRS